MGYSNRQLTCCFCSCSFLVSFLGAVTLGIKIFRNLDNVDWIQIAEQSNKEMASATLDFLAFWFGRSLYYNMSSERPPTTHLVPLVGQVVHVQPAAGNDGTAGSVRASGAGRTAGAAGAAGHSTVSM